MGGDNNRQIFGKVVNNSDELKYNSCKSRFLAKSNRGKGLEIIEN
jgi:hypothetical protein